MRKYEQAMRNIFKETHTVWFRCGKEINGDMIDNMWYRLQGVIEVAFVDDSISHTDFDVLISLFCDLYDVAQIYFLCKEE